MKDIIYLDYAAATPLDPKIKQAMDEASNLFANPSASYSLGREARDQLESARHEVAKTLGAKRTEVYFTSGGTESDNLAILGLAWAHKSSGQHLLTIPTEHRSVLACFEQLEHEGFLVEFVKIDQAGVIDLADLQDKIRSDTTLVSVAMASSEIGSIQRAAEIGRIIASARRERQKVGSTTPIHFHSDGSAAAGVLSLAVARLGVDALSLNAAKIYGPKGSGALYLRTGVVLEPLIFGGEQERGLRAGTENLAGAVGLAMALEEAEKLRSSETKRQLELRNYLLSNIYQKFPKAILNGHKTKRLAGNINISFPGADGEDLVERLDAAGIIVATGAACAATSDEPSHVLRAIGRSRAEAQGSLRISLGRMTTTDQLDALVRSLSDLI